MTRFRLGVIVGLAAAVLFVGCENAVLAPGDLAVGTGDPGDSGSKEPASGKKGLKAVRPTSNLKSFGNEKKLETYLKEQFISSVQPWAYYAWEWNGMDIFDVDIDVTMPLAADATFAASAPAGGESTGTDYSTTNIQELGVDESDVVKTDGTHFYVATGAEVKIVRAVPADGMEVLGSVPVNGPVSPRTTTRTA